jgi:branched-chain amino acid transport system substrate-binding protein
LYDGNVTEDEANWPGSFSLALVRGVLMKVSAAFALQFGTTVDRTIGSLRRWTMSPSNSFRRLGLRTLSCLFALAAVSALGAGAARADVKLGLQVPATGPGATDGKSAQVGAELAVEAVNAAGGVLGQKIQLVTYDDQAKSDQAIFTANKLAGDDGVKLVINGSYSASGRAAAPVFQKAKVVMIDAFAVHPDITKAGDYIFRIAQLGPPQGEAAVLFINKTLKRKKVVVIAMDNDYGQSTTEGFVESAPRYGVTIANKYSYSLKDRQFGSIVASVKRDEPEAIYLSGYFFTAGPLIAQLRAAGIEAPIVGSQAVDSEKLIEIAGASTEGIYIINSVDREYRDAAYEKFVVAFKDRAGYAPEGVAAAVYSSVALMADAITRAGSADADKVRDALAQTKDYALLEKKLYGFTPDREAIMPMPVNQIKDGKFKPLAEITDLVPTSPKSN